MILSFILSVWFSQLQPKKIGNLCDIYHSRTDVNSRCDQIRDLTRCHHNLFFQFLVFFFKCFWGQSLNYGFFCIADFPHVVAKMATGNLALNLGLSAHYLRKKNWLFVDGFRFLIDLASAEFPSRIQPRFSSILIGQACVIASHLRPGINLDILETQTENWSRFSVQEKYIFSTFFLCDYHNNTMKNHGQNFQERQVRKLETSKS